MRYADRTEAGRVLAGHVASALVDVDEPTPLVLGIPRGGVIVAAPIAHRLKGELNVVLARKIGAPGHPELAMGAVGEGGVVAYVEDVIDGLGVPAELLDNLTSRAHQELNSRLEAYRRMKPAPEVRGRVVVVVDDGVATGATFRATLATTRARQPKLLVGAIPVGPRDTTEELAREVDIVVCPERPHWFGAVGQWYDEFTQVSDEEVAAVLRG